MSHLMLIVNWTIGGLGFALAFGAWRWRFAPVTLVPEAVHIDADVARRIRAS